MVFHIVAVGRVRDPSMRAMCEEYAGRSRRSIKLELHEVPDRTRTSKQRDQILRDEGAALLKAVPGDARVVTVSRSGDNCDSATFAMRLREWRHSGRDLAFVIGGAYGVDEAVHKRSDAVLRLSDMTLPHELARLMLLEQLYRGNTILMGEPYHKGD